MRINLNTDANCLTMSLTMPFLGHTILLHQSYLRYGQDSPRRRVTNADSHWLGWISVSSQIHWSFCSLSTMRPRQRLRSSRWSWNEMWRNEHLNGAAWTLLGWSWKSRVKGEVLALHYLGDWRCKVTREYNSHHTYHRIQKSTRVSLRNCPGCNLSLSSSQIVT